MSHRRFGACQCRPCTNPAGEPTLQRGRESGVAMWKCIALGTLLGALPVVSVAEPPAARPAGSSRVSVAAPENTSPSTTTIQMTNGFIQYRADDVSGEEASGAAGAEGSFSVAAPSDAGSKGASANPAPIAATQQSARPAAAPTARPPHHERGPEQPQCLQERALLAQRLLQIRGIYVEPETALITLPQMEVPLSPVITRAFLGTPTPFIGGTLLGSAISFDTETQRLTQQLAKCLLQ